MYELNETITVAIKPCRGCGAGLIDASKFCRSCGAPQSYSSPPDSPTIVSTANVECAHLQHYATTQISQLKLYHPVSGPLVNAVVAGVPASAPRSLVSSFSKRMLLALMAFPIWVMIILLSPLDAYASAKIIGNRI
jgi:hypothetical protein